MDHPIPDKPHLKKVLLRLKNILLIGLFLLGLRRAFHPKLRRREDPDEKETGAEK